MIQAFTRIDEEILALENLSPGSRLTTGSNQTAIKADNIFVN